MDWGMLISSHIEWHGHPAHRPSAHPKFANPGSIETWAGKPMPLVPPTRFRTDKIHPPFQLFHHFSRSCEFALAESIRHKPLVAAHRAPLRWTWACSTSTRNTSRHQAADEGETSGRGWRRTLLTPSLTPSRLASRSLSKRWRDRRPDRCSFAAAKLLAHLRNLACQAVSPPPGGPQAETAGCGCARVSDPASSVLRARWASSDFHLGENDLPPLAQGEIDARRCFLRSISMAPSRLFTDESLRIQVENRGLVLARSPDWPD